MENFQDLRRREHCSSPFRMLCYVIKVIPDQRQLPVRKLDAAQLPEERVRSHFTSSSVSFNVWRADLAFFEKWLRDEVLRGVILEGLASCICCSL